MKVYVLTADTYNENWGSEIELFGVFTTEKKANKRASEMKLDQIILPYSFIGNDILLQKRTIVNLFLYHIQQYSKDIADVKSSFQSNKRMDYYQIIRHKKEKR